MARKAKRSATFDWTVENLEWDQVNELIERQTAGELRIQSWGTGRTAGLWSVLYYLLKRYERPEGNSTGA